MVQHEYELDLRLFRVWMKAYQALFTNIQTDIERYDIGFENFQILELLYSMYRILSKKSATSCQSQVEA